MSKTLQSVLSIVILFTLLISCKSSYPFTKDEEALILNGGNEAPMRVYQITNYNDSILLRTESKKVKVDADDKLLTSFIDRLYATVRDSMSMGVGIAAPQVGILKNIIWVQRFDKEDYPFEVYLNPEIIEYSKEKQPCREGCLSIPNRSDTTYVRSETITIQYDQLDRKQVKESVSGFTAVIFQHEIDHLNGILYLDHLEEEKSQQK